MQSFQTLPSLAAADAPDTSGRHEPASLPPTAFVAAGDVSGSQTPQSNVPQNSEVDSTGVDRAVNLYSVLEIAPNSDTETIRQRINVMFLEAQSNFDHRNFRRRFYYQELYEVHLPQARFHLLDPERRQDYDRSLKLRVLPSASNARAEYSLDSLPSVREEKPANLGADGLDLDSLPSVDDAALFAMQAQKAQRQAQMRAGNIAAAQLAQSAQALSPADAAAIARFKAAQEETLPAAKSAAQSAPTAAPVRSWSARPVAASTQETEALHLERRRDMKRRELIKYELMAVGTQWAAFSAFGTLAIGIAAWFGIQHLVATKNAGANFLINLGGVIACCFIAAAVGRTAHREARRRTVALLSQMPYEQLLRRCAQR